MLIKRFYTFLNIFFYPYKNHKIKFYSKTGTVIKKKSLRKHCFIITRFYFAKFLLLGLQVMCIIPHCNKKGGGGMHIHMKIFLLSVKGHLGGKDLYLNFLLFFFLYFLIVVLQNCILNEII